AIEPKKNVDRRRSRRTHPQPPGRVSYRRVRCYFSFWYRHIAQSAGTLRSKDRPMIETKGAQTPAEDARNRDLVIWLNGQLVPRAKALVSIFDAGFGLGDGVWEGIRLSHGRLVLVEEHLRRLYDGARTIAIEIELSPAQMRAALDEVVAANRMRDGA